MEQKAVHHPQQEVRQETEIASTTPYAPPLQVHTETESLALQGQLPTPAANVDNNYSEFVAYSSPVASSDTVPATKHSVAFSPDTIQEDENQGLPEQRIVKKMKKYIDEKNKTNKWPATSNIFTRFRAIFLNNLAYSARQYCSNVLQIIFPILALLGPTIVTIMLNYSSTSPEGGSRELYLEQISPGFSLPSANGTCCLNEANATESDSFCYGRLRAFVTIEELEPGSDSSGMLTWAGEKSGLLGNVQQAKVLQYPSSYGPQTTENCTKSPYFVPFTSSHAFDDAYIANVTEYTEKCGGGYYYCDSKEQLPTVLEAGVTFKYIKPSERKFKYVLQGAQRYSYIRESTGGLMSRINNAILKTTKNSNSLLRMNNIYGADYADSSSLLDGVTFASNSGFLLLFPLSISFLFPVFLSHAVYEEKKGLVEFVKTYGVSELEYIINRSLFDYGLYLIITVLSVIIALISRHAFFIQGNAGLYIPAILIWGWTLIGLANMLSMVMTNPRDASLIGYFLVLLFMVVGGVLNIFVFDSNIPPWYVMIIAPFAFTRLFADVMMGFMNSAVNPTLNGVVSLAYLAGATIVVLLLGSKVPHRVSKLVYDKLLELVKSLFTVKRVRRQAPLDLHANEMQDKSSVNATHALSDDSIDEDVVHERNCIINGDIDPHSIIAIRHLSKSFKTLLNSRKKKAVDDICLSIRGDECFGLLGPNGAGKTTTIQMLSGLLSPTSGSAFIGGSDIVKQRNQVRKMIGICPQFDIYWDSLAVEEHLLFFARLRGVSMLEERSHVKKVIEEVGLEEAKRRYASKLSGGMKRRLSIAMALIGNPYVVFLDEPTSGLDPASKRGVWDIVLKARKNRCIILTTHSMEEAEALCQRIGIVAGGQLRCLGNLIHLKSKFGSGYKLVVTCDTQNEKRVQEFIKRILPKSHLENAYARTSFYKIQTDDINLGEFCKEMAENSGKIGVKDWSINQATLEEVFLNIAHKFN